MKVFSTQHIFDYCWEDVTKAAFRKYPNRFNPNVTGVDVLKRYVDEQGRLHSMRMIISSFSMWSAVSFVKMLGLEGSMYAVERSIVDPKKRTLTLRSRNISLYGIVQVNEVLTYRPDPANSLKTLLEHEAQITVPASILSGYAEGKLVDVMSDTAVLGRTAIEDVCETVKQERATAKLSPGTM